LPQRHENGRRKNALRVRIYRREDIRAYSEEEVMSSAKSVLEKAVAALNGSDEGAFVALGDPEVELAAPGGLDYKGTAGFRTWYRLWSEAFPDREIRYRNFVGDGDEVIGEGTFTGTQTGTLRLPTGDVPPTGRRLKADFAAVVRAKSGRITYMRHYMDLMDLMGQLGLLGAPASS
jgi:predicted ester cyclase